MFTIAASVMATIFWFFDSSVHYFLYNDPQFEFIPTDFNELWMRTVIVLLIVLFGLFADFFTNRILFKEQQLEVVRIYDSMIHTSNAILTNLLNQMQLFKIEALRSKDFDRNVIKYYDNAIKQATELADTFSKIESMSEKNRKGTSDK